MWNFERKEIAGKAVAWCIEHDIEPNAVGVVSALDALELLNDPAAQQSVQRTAVPAEKHQCSCDCPACYSCSYSD